jgi:hypothetical protein
MRYSSKTEEQIESLTCDELRGVMDRIMRAAADRGYFGDDVAMSEIDRIIRNPRSEGRTRRLFPDELVDGRRMLRYSRDTYVSQTSPRSQEQIKYRLESQIRQDNTDIDGNVTISREELRERIQDGMDSRLGDLEDTIDISDLVRSR